MIYSLIQTCALFDESAIVIGCVLVTTSLHLGMTKGNSLLKRYMGGPIHAELQVANGLFMMHALTKNKMGWGYKRGDKNRKLPLSECYHEFSNSRGIYLLKNH